MFCLRIGSVTVRITVPFLAILAWLFACSDAALRQLAFGACLLHESGHLVMMGLLRQPVRQITCYGVGIQIQAESCLYPLWQDALVLLAGPFCNLLFAGVLWLCGVQGAAVVVQLGIGLLNLLPFQQLDGGAFLRLWLPEQGEWFLRGVCVLLAVGGLCWGGVAGITNITYYCFLGSLLITELLTK